MQKDNYERKRLVSHERVGVPPRKKHGVDRPWGKSLHE